MDAPNVRAYGWTMNSQTLTTMISQNLALADTGLLELKQLVDNGEATAADQHKYLVRKREAIKERATAVTAGTDNISHQVEVKPEVRADAPAVAPPTFAAPAPAKAAKAVKTPVVAKQSTLLPRRGVKASAKSARVAASKR